MLCPPVYKIWHNVIFCLVSKNYLVLFWLFYFFVFTLGNIYNIARASRSVLTLIHCNFIFEKQILNYEVFFTLKELTDPFFEEDHKT